MRLLLDTCALLWFLTNVPKLSTQARTAIEDPGNQRWLSPISLRCRLPSFRHGQP